MDYMCSIVVCYLVHVQLCLHDPREYQGVGHPRTTSTLSTLSIVPTRLDVLQTCSPVLPRSWLLVFGGGRAFFWRFDVAKGQARWLR